MILCLMRIPPALDGHGGSQRAWRLVTALRRHGPVHFVLVCRKADKDATSVSLAPLAPLVESVTTIDIPEWQPTTRKQLWSLPRINTQWGDLARFRCQEAPVVSTAGLGRIAGQLPIRDPDLVFAGRLPSAVIAQALIDHGHLAARRRVVDFDDIMSRFRDRQRPFDGSRLGQGRLIARIDTAIIRRAEQRIAVSWDGVSVCTADDVSELRSAYPAAHVVKVPNVIDRPALAPRAADGTTRVLFVGNLSFSPNIQGLRLFMNDAWPRLRAAVPGALLSVVGLHPGDDVRRLVQQPRTKLHADVPSVQPYYADCDIVVAPILFGSGTRIKILEAMAYGRAVVSTSLGAEGLDLVHGRHLLLADTMEAFAQAVATLALDRDLRLRLADAARAFVAREYGIRALDSAIDQLLDSRPDGNTTAEPSVARTGRVELDLASAER